MPVFLDTSIYLQLWWPSSGEWSVSVNNFVRLFYSLPAQLIFEKRTVSFGSDFIKHHLTGKKSPKSEMFK